MKIRLAIMRTTMNLRDHAAHRAAGFTLIEMLLVIAIAGIMMSMAVPSMAEFIRGQRVRTASFDLYAALTLGRSEGINRNVASSSQISMVPAGPCDSDSCSWAEGWVIRQGATDVQVQSSLTGELTIDGPKQVNFDRAGRVTLTGRTTFHIEAQGTEVKRCVQIDSVGRPSTKTVGCP